MKKLFLLCLVLLITMPVFAQDEATVYTTENGKFQFEIPENWEFMKEEDGKVFLVNVGDVSKYTAMAIKMLDSAPQFESDDEIVQFMFGENVSSFGDYVTDEIGQFKALISETDDAENDTLFIIVSDAELGLLGAVDANVMDAPADLEFLRPVAKQIITSLTYISPQDAPFEELELIKPDISKLTEQYESDDGLLTFNYPEDWIVQSLAENVLLLATSEFTPTSLPDFGMQIFVSRIPQGLGTSGDLLHKILEIIMDSNSSSSNAKILDFNLDGRFAAWVQDDSSDIVMMALLLNEDSFAALIGISGDNPYPDAESLVYAVASTLKITEPDREAINVDTSLLTESYSAFDGRFSFDYPEAWTVEESESGVQVSNVAFDSEEMQTDQIIILVTVYRKSDQENLTSSSSLMDIALTMLPGQRLESANPTEVDLNGHNALVMGLGTPGMDGINVLIDLGDELVGQVLAIADTDEFEQYRDIVYAIASSIELGD